MEMKTCFPFLVNPAGSFLKGFICLLLCSKEFGEKISLSGEINTCQKLYRISQGEDLCESLYFTNKERKGYFMCIVGELVRHFSFLQGEKSQRGVCPACVFQLFSDRSVLCLGCEDFC